MYITPTTTKSDAMKERARIREILHGDGLTADDRGFFYNELDELDLYIESFENRRV